jgi:hypothetical protein
MNAPKDPLNLDEVLLPFLAVNDQVEEDRILSGLIQTHAEPIIRGLLRRKLSGSKYIADQAAEIRSEVILKLLSRLRQLKREPAEHSIHNLRGYIVTVTNRAWNDQLRAKYPNRSKLKNRVWYVLSRDSTFFLRRAASGEWICGFKEWEQLEKPIGFGDAFLNERFPDLRRFQVQDRSGLPGASSLRSGLEQLFSFANGPLNPDDVVEMMSRIYDVRDESTLRTSADTEFEMDNLIDERINPSKSMETTQFLKKLWIEICDLPVRQRVALLLNLKDSEGRDILSTLPLTGTATFREIAAVLEIAPNDFITLWKQLPIEDTKIAEFMEITRQQVINLRKSARERLVRKLKTILF